LIATGDYLPKMVGNINLLTVYLAVYMKIKINKTLNTNSFKAKSQSPQGKMRLSFPEKKKNRENA
jgi:hypothetical protein